MKEYIPLNWESNKSIIKVIGVGGGGGNAVSQMFQQGIKDVDFMICNTDTMALQGSPVPEKVQLGNVIAKGLGAGCNPEQGRRAALETIDSIKESLSGSTEMVFITAGMGGGTGTGAAPVIAQIAKEMG
ncbi:MAG: cell division protein FtsZ, partial [Bacteroidales bacterium]|nr:cell division protein FtsZ [Bacteroidales bacterium]